jgi:hypothetical protein
MKDTQYIFHDANILARNVKELIWLHDYILWITNVLVLSQCLPYRTDWTSAWPTARALSFLSFTSPRSRPFQGPLFLQCFPPPLPSLSYWPAHSSDTSLSLYRRTLCLPSSYRLKFIRWTQHFIPKSWYKESKTDRKWFLIRLYICIRTVLCSNPGRKASCPVWKIWWFSSDSWMVVENYI